MRAPNRPLRHAAIVVLLMLLVAGAAHGGSSCAYDLWEGGGSSGAPSARSDHTAIWTGSVMIVWGGFDGDGYVNTGGRYDPATGSWTPTSLAGAPSARGLHSAVWTGSEMVVWGGVGYDDGYEYLATGGRYDPVTDTWAPIATSGAPSGRIFHSAVWAQDSMIVWGGLDGVSTLGTGGRYDPASNTWTATSVAGSPAARGGHTAVWTGDTMVVWGGGTDSSPYYLDTGGRYDPATNAWTATSLDGAPSPRDQHTAVWTGSEMVVWGGYAQGHLDTGGRYDPASDAWTPTPSGSAPLPRSAHTAIWTGTEMVVWGGDGDEPPHDLDTGGRYDPATGTWTATSIAGAPTARSSHTAVWTGAEMIVWGGSTGSSLAGTLGRYLLVPALDDDGDGSDECHGDCDDADAAVHPGAHEVCNGADDDCDQATDEGGDALCDDGSPCTQDACHGASACVHVPLPGTACEDGNACTAGDSCSALGICVAGPVPDCGDLDPCTADACDPATGCVPTPSSCARFDFAPPSSPVPAGFVKDDGSVFSPVRGIGWSFAVGTRARNSANPIELDTFAFSQGERSWTAEVANGDYDVCVRAGDPSFPQGPQRMRANGLLLLDDVSTQANEFASSCRRIPARGGRLLVTIGGTAGNTLLNDLEMELAPGGPAAFRSISFEPAGSAVAPGFLLDQGEVFDAVRGYGWDAPVPGRERNRPVAQVLDTFVFSSSVRTWELALPNGSYDVWYGLGDPDYPEGPHRLEVEGSVAVQSPTAAGAFLEGKTAAQVSDGRLTVRIGQGTSAVTTLNYLVVAPFDTDGDGVPDVEDDCPLAADPGQEDADRDGAGSACDGCPLDFDPSQSDGDGDGVGNACDLDDGAILLIAVGRDEIAWAETGATSWNAYVGDLDVLRATGAYTQPPGSNALARRACALTEPRVADLGDPPAGRAAFVLVTGVASGVEGSLGRDGEGALRPNESPCP